MGAVSVIVYSLGSRDHSRGEQRVAVTCGVTRVPSPRAYPMPRDRARVSPCARAGGAAVLCELGARLSRVAAPRAPSAQVCAVSHIDGIIAP